MAQQKAQSLCTPVLLSTTTRCPAVAAAAQTMEQAARELANDTVAATQAVMAQYQAELDAARREDDEVAERVGTGQPKLVFHQFDSTRVICSGSLACGPVN